MRQGPIGVFDSGLGGLTVAQALGDLLPSEDLLYVGDTARYPYGERSIAEVRRFSQAIARELADAGIKLLVVACNSATAAALDLLRAQLDVPVVGVVEPGLRAASKVSRARRILVISTRLTASSGVYERAAQRLDLGLHVTTRACPGFVELVEEGLADTPIARTRVAEQLAPLLTARVDTLVLGCTHFPLLARSITEITGRRITLVSSADETAFEVRDLLERTGWLRSSEQHGSLTAWTTGDVGRFRELGARFLGERLTQVHARAIQVDGPVHTPA